MTNLETAFKTLELTEKKPSDYTIQEIRKAYLRLALKNHPDKNPKDIEGASAKFKELGEAYENIINDRKAQAASPSAAPPRTQTNVDTEGELFDKLYNALNQYNIEEFEKALETLNTLSHKQQTIVVNQFSTPTLLGLLFEQGLGKGEGLTRYVDNLLRAGADVHLKDQRGMTPLHQLSATRKLMRKAKEINSGSLEVAPLQETIVIAEQLFAAGADINAMEKGGWAPLYFAASARNKNMVAWLISRGANVNATSEYGQTPLELAISFPSYQIINEAEHHRESEAIVRLLLENGAKVDQQDCTGRTILHRAIASHNPGVIGLLLKAGADINAVDDKLNTALHTAVLLKDQNIVQYLIEQGADLTLKNFHHDPRTKKVNRQTPYELAVAKGYAEIAALLKPATEAQLAKKGPEVTETTTPKGLEGRLPRDVDNLIRARTGIQDQGSAPAEKFESYRKELQSLLKHYIEKVESHRKDNHPDFEFGFWFFKKSRAHNREANYFLATQLHRLLDDPTQSIQTIFDKTNMDNIRNQKDPTLGIHSAELNSVIARAREITENAASKPRFMR